MAENTDDDAPTGLERLTLDELRAHVEALADDSHDAPTLVRFAFRELTTRLLASVKREGRLAGELRKTEVLRADENKRADEVLTLVFAHFLRAASSVGLPPDKRHRAAYEFDTRAAIVRGFDPSEWRTDVYVDPGTRHLRLTLEPRHDTTGGVSHAYGR